MKSKDPLTIEVFLGVLASTVREEDWRVFLIGNRVFMRRVDDPALSMWTPLTVVLHQLVGREVGPDEDARLDAVQEEFPTTPIYQTRQILDAEDGNDGCCGFSPVLHRRIHEIVGLRVVAS